MAPVFTNYNSVANIADGSYDIISTDIYIFVEESFWTYNPNATTDNQTSFLTNPTWDYQWQWRD